MDLCEKKYFINLSEDIYITHYNKRIISIMEGKKNCWTKKKKIHASKLSEVLEFKSIKKNYVDLVVKFFFDLNEFEEEIKNIDFFKNERCRNFIKIGHLRSEKIVVMEKLDGDVHSLHLNYFPYPKIIFIEFIKFLSDVLMCCYKNKKIYGDIKLENFGFKLCKKNIKFAPLDFGSFSSLNSHDTVKTFFINYSKDRKGNFKKSLAYVYGVIVTILSLRLKIVKEKYYNNFTDLIIKIGERKYYPKTDLLTLKIYEEIKDFYYSKIKEKDEFVEMLFNSLYSLTKRNPNIGEFLEKINFY